jgi:hypothetical protein
VHPRIVLARPVDGVPIAPVLVSARICGELVAARVL